MRCRRADAGGRALCVACVAFGLRRRRRRRCRLSRRGGSALGAGAAAGCTHVRTRAPCPSPSSACPRPRLSPPATASPLRWFDRWPTVEFCLSGAHATLHRSPPPSAPPLSLPPRHPATRLPRHCFSDGTAGAPCRAVIAVACACTAAHLTEWCSAPRGRSASAAASPARPFHLPAVPPFSSPSLHFTASPLHAECTRSLGPAEAARARARAHAADTMRASRPVSCTSVASPLTMRMCVTATCFRSASLTESSSWNDLSTRNTVVMMSLAA